MKKQLMVVFGAMLIAGVNIAEAGKVAFTNKGYKAIENTRNQNNQSPVKFI